MALDVSVRDIAAAHALRPRIEAMTRRLIPQILDQVFDALLPPDQHLQLPRLELDLGVLRPAHLEDDLGKALGAALADALATALHRARQTPGEAGHLRAAQAHALHQFENYLATGLLPFQGQAWAFDAPALFHALAQDQPTQLVAMLRRHARNTRMLERLVLQLGETGLAELLAVVAPADALTILMLLGDVVTAHRSLRAPLWEAAAEPKLRRSLWITTLEFLLHDAGSNFNRRRFLAVLLRREAARLGIGYRALLRLLATAVRRAASRAPLRSGLPAVLMGLLQEPQDSDAQADDQTDEGWPQWDSALGLPGPGLSEQIAHYLLTGLPADGGGDMPGRAAHKPEVLGAQARRLARAKLVAAPVLAQRLLRAWLPQELLQALAPELAAGMATDLVAAWAAAGGEGEVEDWQPIVTALLLDQTPSLPPPPTSASTFSSMPSQAGARLDQVARLARWLDGAGLPGTPAAAAAHAARAVAHDDLLQLGLAELAELFLADDAAQTAARIGVAVQTLPSASRHQLLTRLAPWATSPTGPLAATLAGLSEAGQVDLLVRACAAALSRHDIDLAALLAGTDASPATTGTAAPCGALEATPALNGNPRPGPAPAPWPVAHASQDECEQALAWLDGASAGHAQAERLSHCLAAMADAGHPGLLRYLARARNQPAARARWAKVLPPEVLGRLVHQLVPASARTLLDGMRLLNTAWRQTAGFGTPRPDPADLWATLFDLIAAPEPVNVPAVLAALARRLARADAARLQVVRDRAVQLAETGGHVSVAAALRRTVSPGAEAPAAAGAAQRATAPADGSTRTAASSRPKPPVPAPPAPPRAGAQDAEPKDALYIRNAGLVLLAPMLPTLFERLGLLQPDEAGVPRIAGEEAASRGVHLLQYLVDGRLDRPEPELALNKLLCGLPTAHPVAPSLAPSPGDLAQCDGLLAAVMGYWPAMKNSTGDALRQTFLQREGRLLHGPSKWTLQVQRKTVDVLVDQLPWSFSLVYHRWMTDPLHVTW